MTAVLMIACMLTEGERAESPSPRIYIYAIMILFFLSLRNAHLTLS